MPTVSLAPTTFEECSKVVVVEFVQLLEILSKDALGRVKRLLYDGAFDLLSFGVIVVIDMVEQRKELDNRHKYLTMPVEVVEEIEHSLALLKLASCSLSTHSSVYKTGSNKTPWIRHLEK
ncbi:hypothetical protein Tco_0593351 [Tanacetum coccineum]